RTVFSAYSTLEGTGLLRDLSMGGCCIESPVTVEAGVSLQLLTYAPDVPLLIEAATVQWVRPQTFGVGFFRISEYTRLQLAQVISS
ncbi:MAG: PilZ domain-containing protein, partial [Nitrospirales bacterium]